MCLLVDLSEWKTLPCSRGFNGIVCVSAGKCFWDLIVCEDDFTEVFRVEFVEKAESNLLH